MPAETIAKKLRIPATARGGRIHFAKWAMEKYIEWCQAFDGKEISVEMSVGGIRRLAQNNLYWGVILRKGFVPATGETNVDYHHAVLRERLCKIAVENAKGEVIWTTEDTSSMTITRYSEFIEQAIQILTDEYHYGIPEDERGLYLEAQGIKEGPAPEPNLEPIQDTEIGGHEIE